jgi:hypothetical protein
VCLSWVAKIKKNNWLRFTAEQKMWIIFMYLLRIAFFTFHLCTDLMFVLRSFIFYFETLSFSDQQLCDPGEFLCHDHVTCVSQSWLCDGDPDCPDDSDESLDTCE